MKLQSLIAILLLVVGIACLGVGVYTYQGKSIPSPTPTPQVIEKLVYVTPTTAPTTSETNIAFPQNSSLVKRISVNEWQVIVPAIVEDVDTGIGVPSGKTITISASGTANAASSTADGAFKWIGPDGWGESAIFNKGRKLPLPAGSSFMALCYRIGKGRQQIDDGRWEFAGSKKSFVIGISGNLHFTVNDAVRNEYGQYLPQWRTDNQGSFIVRFRIE